MDVSIVQLWFSGKEMLRDKKVKDYLGRNEKTKVIVKLHKRGSGKPGREPVMSEEERKMLMLHAYKRQEQFKVRDYILIWIEISTSSLPPALVFTPPGIQQGTEIPAGWDDKVASHGKKRSRWSSSIGPWIAAVG